MQMPRDIGPFHIIGIGGIGMSAIAEILLAKGYTVQGSDQKESANVSGCAPRASACSSAMTRSTSSARATSSSRRR